MQAPKLYETYKSVALLDIEEAVPLLISKMSPLSPGSKILDYGCGAGSTGNKFFLPLAQQLHSKMHAIDSSSEMIASAKEDYGKSGVKFYTGNVLDDAFPLKKKKYDRIFAIYVFHYIQDYKSAMKGIQHILKPGGEFGFSVLARTPLFHTYRVVGEHPLFKDHMKGYEEFIPKWFQEAETVEHAKECFDHLVTSLDFEVVHSQIHYQKRTVDVDVMVGLCVSLNPYCRDIPEELDDCFRRLYREATTKICGVAVDAESYELSYEMLTYVIRKKGGSN